MPLYAFPGMSSFINSVNKEEHATRHHRLAEEAVEFRLHSVHHAQIRVDPSPRAPEDSNRNHNCEYNCEYNRKNNRKYTCERRADSARCDGCEAVRVKSKKIAFD